jgi:hypothetical protein
VFLRTTVSSCFGSLMEHFLLLTVASLLFIKGRGRTEALCCCLSALLCFVVSFLCVVTTTPTLTNKCLLLLFFFSLHLEERQLQICERVRSFRKQERTFQEKFPLCASCILLLLVLHSCCYTNCCHDASTFCFYHSVTSAYHKLYELKKTRNSKKKKKKHGFSKVRSVRKILYIYA